MYKTLKPLAFLLCLFATAKTAQAQIITTFAGNGGTNSSGDGGLAINASFEDPWGMCVSPRDTSI